ncbi:UNVERIFIED_CONTAM: hypothetical protein Scaly_3118100 [Sesamum calycinum]|uniref:DUF4283 domain-containing protein n=1 Tax=Sesamum calycinum TaxID=2727403 RepID=A0AAW2JKZ2_9LAMI
MGFYELANQVLNGDSEAMANLNSLKDRWELKFKTSKNPALKSVSDRPSTPFRPRISLLPRRSVRTGTDSVLTDSVNPVVRPGIDSHGSSSSSHLGLAISTAQDQGSQESLIPPISDVPAQLLEDLSQDSRKEGPSRNSEENEPLEASIPRHQPAAGNLVGSERPDCRDDEIPLQDYTPLLDSTPPMTHPNIYIGNVKLQAEYVDTIAGGFFNHLARPYTLSLRQDRTAKSSSGQQRRRSTMAPKSGGQRRRLAMEDVIEGGPWLFQGQPIVLQPWEQGMSLRRQKHTQIPVWIRLRHLPMEYWTDEGLSTVASGVGTPLYTDGITKDCSRLDFARVCVMLDFNSALPKHLVVISPILRNGKEDPKRIDVEYEWLPQRCKSCCSLGHVSATCPANMKKNVAPR